MQTEGTGEQDSTDNIGPRREAVITIALLFVLATK